MPRIALLQLNAQKDPTQNIEKTLQSIREAAAAGAKIICTQELFATEYFCTTQDPQHFSLAHSIPNGLTEKMCDLAALLDVVIIASGFEKRNAGIYHNTAWVIDADGTFMGIYRKSHIPQDPGFEEKYYFTPGDTGYKTWNTKYGKIGVLICWDQWFPEAARLTAMQGAEIIFYPTAIGWLPEEKETLGASQHYAWQSVQCGHAVANTCYIAAVNRTGTENNTQFWGQSFVANHLGEVVAQSPPDEEMILYHDCDLSALEEHRRMWPFFRDRRIDTYHDLTDRTSDGLSD